MIIKMNITSSGGRTFPDEIHENISGNSKGLFCLSIQAVIMRDKIIILLKGEGSC